MTSTDQKTSSISIIIPALNEEGNIASTILSAADRMIDEIIVVDGGSSDRTIALAESHGARVLSAEPGRANQMNKGAAAAKADTLLFIHGDTTLPDNFGAEIIKLLSSPNTAAGAFGLGLDRPGTAFRFVELMVSWRCLIFSMPYGDQGLFLKKNLFAGAGGFPSLPIMEDVVFINKLKKRGKIRISRKKVKSSARRWQQLGVLKTTLLNQAILLAYRFGVSPNRLNGWYRITKE